MILAVFTKQHLKASKNIQFFAIFGFLDRFTVILLVCIWTPILDDAKNIQEHLLRIKKINEILGRNNYKIYSLHFLTFPCIRLKKNTFPIL